jgi:tetratricopeptide (TPR) repeat protein
MRSFKRAVLLLAIGAAAGAGLCGCMSKAKRHVYAAEDLFEKRDLKGAQVELREAIKDDPDMLDAHKSLAHVDEYLGDEQGAEQEYEIASRLDPTDSKLFNKARYYRQLRELENSAGKALDDIKAGRDDEGLNTLKTILTDTSHKTAHDNALASLREAAPLIAQQGNAFYQAKKYDDAVIADGQAIRAYTMIAEATGKQQLDPAAEQVMRSLSAASQAGGSRDRAFTILNDVVAFDPENKVANAELAKAYLMRQPPDYATAADLMERAGAPDSEVKAMRARAKTH